MVWHFLIWNSYFWLILQTLSNINWIIGLLNHVVQLAWFHSTRKCLSWSGWRPRRKSSWCGRTNLEAHPEAEPEALLLQRTELRRPRWSWCWKCFATEVWSRGSRSGCRTRYLVQWSPPRAAVGRIFSADQRLWLARRWRFPCRPVRRLCWSDLRSLWTHLKGFVPLQCWLRKCHCWYCLWYSGWASCSTEEARKLAIPEWLRTVEFEIFRFHQHDSIE